jgi:hypothetical protein
MTNLTHDQFDQLYGNTTEHDYLGDIDPASKHLWTAIDGEGYTVDYISGYHFVNCLYYVVSEKPWTEETFVSSFPEGAEYIAGLTCGWDGTKLDSEMTCPLCGEVSEDEPYEEED